MAKRRAVSPLEHNAGNLRLNVEAVVSTACDIAPVLAEASTATPVAPGREQIGKLNLLPARGDPLLATGAVRLARA